MLQLLTILVTFIKNVLHYFASVLQENKIESILHITCSNNSL